MCLSNEHRRRPDDESAEPAARPVSTRSAAMPREAEMRQTPTPTPKPATKNTSLIPATTKTSAAATKPPTTTTPASKSKSVVVSQEDPGARSRRGTAATLPPRHGSVPFPLTETPLNATFQPRQHSTTSALGKEQAQADEYDLESLQLTLSRSGSVTYASTPRMSRNSLGGVATRTKTRDRIVVIDESGRRREYFK